MIENLFNNNINSLTETLFQCKDQILASAQKRDQEGALKKVPTPDQFETELKGYITDNVTPSQLVEIENKLNKAINLIEKAISKLKAIKKPLDQIRNKISNIEAKLSFLNEISGMVSEITSFINPLISIIDGLLVANSGPAANGATINKLGEQKKEIKNLIKRGSNTANSISSVQGFFFKEIDKLITPLDDGISSLNEAIEFLENLLLRFQSIWGDFLTQTLSNINLENTEYENIDFTTYLENKEDNTSDIISDLIGINEGNISTGNLAFKRFKI